MIGPQGLEIARRQKGRERKLAQQFKVMSFTSTGRRQIHVQTLESAGPTGWDERGGSLSREICVSLDLKQRFALEVQIQELREV